jgi:glycosyltransferase involved in cell wall biosynthesis
MEHKLRILVLIDSLLEGGAEKAAVELACALDRDRFAPHLLVTRQSGPLQRLVDAAGLPTTVLGRTHRLSPAAYRTARRLAAESDLIHAHKLGSAVWGALLARRARVPLVVHDHNWSERPTWRKGLLLRAWVAPPAVRFLCVSAPVAEAVAAQGIPGDRVEVLPNGVALDTALPRAEARSELGLRASEFVAGIVARLRAEKAHEVVLEALAELRAAGRPIRLCVVGSGERDEELRRLADRLGIDGAVVWAGERPDAARLVSAFDASVLCSDWEGLPLAALESLAAGVPLVATAVGGLPDLLGDGAGLLVEPRRPRALADALARLMDAPEEAANLARLGRARAAGYELGAVARRVEAVYEGVLEERGVRGPSSEPAGAGAS